MTPVNSIPTRSGKVRAVCEFCNRKSKPVGAANDGEPSIWALPLGWSTAPYPRHFKHQDGSVGSKWTCPKCTTRLNAGESLRVHESRGNAQVFGRKSSTADVAGDQESSCLTCGDRLRYAGAMCDNGCDER